MTSGCTKSESIATDVPAPEDRGANSSTMRDPDSSRLQSDVMDLSAPEDRGAQVTTVVQKSRRLRKNVKSVIPRKFLAQEPIFSADIGTDSGAASSLSFVDSGRTGVTPYSTEPGSSIPKEVTELDVLHLRSHTSEPSLSGAQGATPSDFAFLYFTLLSDGAVPAGFLDDFLKLEIPASKAAARLIKLNASISDTEAELSLEREKRIKLACARESTAACDQLLVAADIKPRRFKSRLQRSCYEGPTASKDAESAERMRWISLLADLLRNTQTPMGCLLRENPANSQLLGGGRAFWDSSVEGTIRPKISELAGTGSQFNLPGPLEATD